jgi:hypothetical protein
MNQIPVFIVSPSIIIASHSTSPSVVSNDPRPALKYLLSSSKRTAFSTASTAVPPSCQNSLVRIEDRRSIVICMDINCTTCSQRKIKNRLLTSFSCMSSKGFSSLLSIFNYLLTQRASLKRASMSAVLIRTGL